MNFLLNWDSGETFPAIKEAMIENEFSAFFDCEKRIATILREKKEPENLEKEISGMLVKS
jgi:hypothetical protein